MLGFLASGPQAAAAARRRPVSAALERPTSREEDVRRLGACRTGLRELCGPSRAPGPEREQDLPQRSPPHVVSVTAPQA